MSGAKNNFVQAFSALILHCASFVNPDSTILMPKDALRWRKLLVNMALNIDPLCAYRFLNDYR